MTNNGYVRPDNIPQAMGGDGVNLDARLKGVFDLMRKAPINSGQKILEVGMGGGQLAKWLAQQGMFVTGTGHEIASYCDVDDLRSQGIEAVPCDVNSMPFDDCAFDVVVMSHVLEHCLDVHSALKEVRRVLKDQGWLLIFVPGHGLDVSAGHVSMGWSVGHLMYVLLVAGFRVKDGRYITHAGSVCGFVRKDSQLLLPPLRGDRGDLNILGKLGFFPLPIRSRDGFNDGFLGPMGALNWDLDHVRELRSRAALGTRLTYLASRMIPRGQRLRLARILTSVGKVLCEIHNTNPAELGN